MINQKIYLFFFLFFFPLYSEDYSYLELLNRSDSIQVKALKEASLLFQWEENTQFKLLEGGLTQARLYSFEFEGEKYVLRFLSLSHSQEMRKNEIQAISIGNKIGVAPRLTFFDTEAILMVMPFVKGHSLCQPDSDQLKKIGIMLKKLHDYSSSYPIKYSLNDRLLKHYQKGKTLGIAYPTGFEEEMKKIFDDKEFSVLVPCHGDLNPSNILVNEYSQDIVLIDWTSATMEDPFFDLGFFCLLSNLSAFDERVFLEAYYGRKPTKYEIERLSDKKANICLLTATIWFRFSETKEEMQLPLDVRIAALDNELYSAELKPIQEYLKEGIVVHINKAPKSEIRSYALSFYKAYLDAKKKS